MQASYEIVPTAKAANKQTFKMAVHKHPDTISGIIKRSGTWEPTMCQTLAAVFETARIFGQQGLMTFLDVGSNIGFHSLCLAAPLDGTPMTHTVSVEANQKNYGALWTSRELNQWQQHMSIFRVAVSDGSSTEPLCFRAFTGNMGGNSAVDPQHHQRIGWHQDIPCDYVPVTTIDAVLRDAAQQQHNQDHMCPLVMKLDVEGFEHRALLGAKQLLEKYTPCLIAMEFHVPLLKAAAAAPPIETLQRLVDAGYEPKSHSLEKLRDIVTRNAIVDTIWEHTTMKSGAPTGDTCWSRCFEAYSR